MYFVYVLLSEKDKRFYTGITNDLEQRIKKHNHGYKATKSTLNRGPFRIVFVQICEDRTKARALEKYLKSGCGREVRDEILKFSEV